MIDRARYLLNTRDQNGKPEDKQLTLEEEVAWKADSLNRYSKQLEILNQASVMINSIQDVPSILRTVAQAALELWESDGGAAGIVEDGELVFRDWYWKGEHHTGQFRCNILPDLNNMSGFMGVLRNEDKNQNDNYCFPSVKDGEIKERLAIPIYDRQLKVQACLLLFNPSSDMSEKNPIDHPLPGLISNAGTALNNTRNLLELRNKENELQTSLKEKELLLKEIHHRVKNNLQAIVGLLEARLGSIQNPRDKEIFLKGQSLAMGMARIHELLYSTRDYTKVNFTVYIRELTKSILELYPDIGDRIKVEYSLDDFFLNTDTAIPVSLIINELISNALIHAFPDGRKGTIFIFMKQVENGGIVMEVADDGIGMADFVDETDRQALGLDLVHSLMENLHGFMKVTVNGGTRTTIRFKEYFECENLELGEGN